MRPARVHLGAVIVGNDRFPTNSGKNYCDSVFGPMAFFPIVIRKVQSYVALHNEIQRGR